MQVFLIFLPPSCCENCDLASDFVVFAKTRTDFDEWRLNDAVKEPVCCGNNAPLGQGCSHFVIGAPGVIGV